MKLIIDEEFANQLTSECAEAMTLHLLNIANPQDESSECGCLRCLAHLCVEIVLERMHEESEEFMRQEKRNQKIDRRNIN